jgi:hypothetical protein
MTNLREQIKDLSNQVNRLRYELYKEKGICDGIPNGDLYIDGETLACANMSDEFPAFWCVQSGFKAEVRQSKYGYQAIIFRPVKR